MVDQQPVPLSRPSGPEHDEADAGPWEFRALWPVQDPTLGSRTAIKLAAENLPEVLERGNARLLGDPQWRIEEVEDPTQWPYTEFAVVAVAPAVPAHPSREQWPAIVARLAGEGWSDRRIGELFAVPTSLVETVRRVHDIAAGEAVTPLAA
jgi:hypothetical protein